MKTTPPSPNYRHDPGAFIDAYVRFNEKGQAWALAPYQRRLLSLAFQFDASGRLGLRLLLWSEPKKSGKTFIAACLALWWAFTRPNTEVVIAANDLDQSVGRVFKTIVDLCKRNGFEQTKLVKIRATWIECKSGTVITAIASDFAGAAGGRQSLTVFDELWGYNPERLTRLFEELTPPPSEPEAWQLVVTYAGFSNESALLRSMYERGLEGERIDADLPVYRATGGMVMYWSHVGRQVWQTADYYEEQRRLLRPGTYLRIHENRWVSAESTFITAELHDGCVVNDLQPHQVPADTSVFWAVDAAIKRDGTAVEGVAWVDGVLQKVAGRRWYPTSGAPVNLAEVEDFIRKMAGRYDSVFVCDPFQFQRSIAALRDEGIRITELPQTPTNITRYSEALLDLMRSGALRLYPDDEFRAQALSVMAIETPRGLRLGKSAASKKIDAVAATAMACMLALEEGDTPPLTLIGSNTWRAWQATHPQSADLFEDDPIEDDDVAGGCHRG